MRSIRAMRVIVATTLLPHEQPEIVVSATRSLFPDWNPEEIPARRKYPTKANPIRLVSDVSGLEKLIENCKANRILDTALDAMSLNSDGGTTHFSLSRQAALAGRCSFVIEEAPVGGTIDVTLTCVNLDAYLAEVTYHTGREEYPRYPNDESSMNDDGSSSIWVSKKRR